MTSEAFCCLLKHTCFDTKKSMDAWRFDDARNVFSMPCRGRVNSDFVVLAQPPSFFTFFNALLASKVIAGLHAAVGCFDFIPVVILEMPPLVTSLPRSLQAVAFCSADQVSLLMIAVNDRRVLYHLRVSLC